MYVLLLQCNLWKASFHPVFALLSFFLSQNFFSLQLQKCEKKTTIRTICLPAMNLLFIVDAVAPFFFVAASLFFYGFFFCETFWLENFAIERKLYGFINHKQSSECCSNEEKKMNGQNCKTTQKNINTDIFFLCTKKNRKRKDSGNCIFCHYSATHREEIVSFSIFFFVRSLKENSIITIKRKKDIENVSAVICRHNE